MKRLLYVLLLLGLLCSCSAPAAETPEFAPTAEMTATPVPTPTPETVQTGKPEPGPALPDWAGKGVSHTSEALGLTLELPPEWADLVAFTERVSYEGLLKSWDGRVPCVSIDYRPNADAGEPDTALPVLDPSGPIAYLYWLPEGQSGPEADYGSAVTLLEKGTGRWVCHLPMNSVAFDSAEFGQDSPEWTAYRTVEQGLLEGDFVAAEVADPFAWTHVVNPWVEDDRAVVDGLGHVPLDTLPREVLDSLEMEMVEETSFDGFYPDEWGYKRHYTAPGLEIVTTAPTAAYLEYKAEMDKDNRDLYPTEADFWADIEGEEGREWIVRATLTDDSYATHYGLKVGLTVEEAEKLGYPLSTRKDYGAYEKLEVTVEDGVVTELLVHSLLGRYIGKFFEM